MDSLASVKEAVSRKKADSPQSTNFIRRRGPESGLGKLTVLVFGTIVAVTLYCAYYIGPFFYYYFELLNQMESVIRVAGTETDQEIRGKLWYHIKKMQLPVSKEDLKIEREDGVMKIQLQYEEVFYVTWQEKDYEVYRFPFDAYVEGAF